MERTTVRRLVFGALAAALLTTGSLAAQPADVAVAQQDGEIDGVGDFGGFDDPEWDLYACLNYGICLSSDEPRGDFPE